MKIVKNILRGILWAIIVVVISAIFENFIFEVWDMDFFTGWVAALAYAAGSRTLKGLEGGGE